MTVTLERYLKQRRLWETLLWVGFFLFNWIANTLVVQEDLGRFETEFAAWEPAVWEGSSGLVMLALLPLLLWFDRRFPLHRGQLGLSVGAHLLATIPYSLLHVVGMVLLREGIYALFGRGYDFGPWSSELVYEYLKDFRSYWSLIAIIYLYRFLLRRLQGEAGFLQEQSGKAAPAPVTDRFLVKKLGREFLVRIDDIDWIEAAGNYVNLHVGPRVYPLRDTMNSIEARLAESGFLRVHRSAIVNLDQVVQINPFDTGDAEIELASGQRVAASRSYRRILRERVALAAAMAD